MNPHPPIRSLTIRDELRALLQHNGSVAAPPDRCRTRDLKNAHRERRPPEQLNDSERLSRKRATMIYALPGMGATSAMYAGPWRELTDCRFLDWPHGGREKSIADLAAHMIDLGAIRDGSVLVGSSLGGIVACEIARLRRIDRVFLIGGARKKEEMNVFLQVLYPLIDVVPIVASQRVSARVPSPLGQMFSQSDPRFIRNMSRAIFEWDGLQPGVTEVRRLHGKRDMMIPPPNDGEELLDGGHMLAMTHPTECIRFIQDNLSPVPTKLRRASPPVI